MLLSPLLAPLLSACVDAPIAPSAAFPDSRRSGFEQMSAATQSLQRDDSANPAFLWVQAGEQRFARDCAACHSAKDLRGAAARHPAWSDTLGQAVTLAQRIDQCQQQKVQGTPFSADGEALLELEAYVAHQSRGLAIQAVTDPRLQDAMREGQGLWQMRLGQLQLSCSECHDQYAGRRLAGSTIPQAHPTGYPIYRLEWQGMGNLERRMRGCLTGVRAEPFAPQAREWVALELWLKQRAAGMLLETPGVRP